MKIQNIKGKKTFIDYIVKNNARVSYSGTSSGIIALASAKAASMLKSKVFYTTVFVSPFIYLNSAHIGIPKLGRCGMRKIVAAGLIIKKPELGLHILQDISLDTIKQINELCKNTTKINVEVQYNTAPVYCRVIAVDDKSNVADVIIKNEATAFASVKFNNKESIKVAHRYQELKKHGFANADEVMDYVTTKEAYALAKEFKLEELTYLDEHIKTNVKFCEAGMKTKEPSSISHHFNEAIAYLSQPEHGYNKYRWSTELLDVITAGIDARMGGCPLPTITSAVNGDHGLVAVVVPYIYGRRFNKSKEKIYQSILLSHFITWKISIKIGKLCIMCGTAVAAVAGALAAVAFQNDVPWEKVEKMLNMHLIQQAGTLCYGSSPSCAFQVLCALQTGLTTYSLVMHGAKVPHKDGLCHDDFEQTLNNFKHYTSGTRDEAVNTIVKIYQNKFNERGE